ncbi:MAG: hypothetical protein AAFR65_12860 [Pseudomonadota bacterium]
MFRRLRILLVDALVMLAIGSVVLVVMTRQPASSAANLILAEPFTASVGATLPARDANRGTELSQRIYTGEDVASAVIARREDQALIFPGDRVDIFDWQAAEPLFRDVPVIAIDPAEHGQVRMTFALRVRDMQPFKDARQRAILTANRSTLSLAVNRKDFDPALGEVIERRFEPEQWNHRLPSR